MHCKGLCPGGPFWTHLETFARTHARASVAAPEPAHTFTMVPYIRAPATPAYGLSLPL